ncbi:glycogen synthase [Klenkia terrae]|uniref:glycogen synthase n=1 Tax=Klenkia terrae TaxID=1052259 RepID=UPI00361DAED7
MVRQPRRPAGLPGARHPARGDRALLEPRRPWKADQLGGGYRLSSWVERTAYLAADAVIAVSNGMRTDVLDAYPELDPDKVLVVGNGVDAEAYRPVHDDDVVRSVGVDPDRPYALFVGRITRQKGLVHLLAAAEQLPPDAGLVLCAGAADTPAERQQVADAVARLQQQRTGVVWIEEMLPRQKLVPLITGATVFVVPSVYEPLGIVNLEAAACGTAVVASAVGGIPEVVDDGRTGLLVPYDEADPAAFAAGLAARMTELLADPDRAAGMGAAGRDRVLAEFGWPAIAEQTVAVYQRVLAARS